jgi:hypothetical protein
VAKRVILCFMLNATVIQILAPRAFSQDVHFANLNLSLRRTNIPQLYQSLFLAPAMDTYSRNTMSPASQSPGFIDSAMVPLGITYLHCADL